MLTVKSKFMQSLDSQVYIELSRLAKEKGVSVQELIRALIIPDWIRRQDKPEGDRESVTRRHGRKLGLEKRRPCNCQSLQVGPSEDRHATRGNHRYALLHLEAPRSGLAGTWREAPIQALGNSEACGSCAVRAERA